MTQDKGQVPAIQRYKIGYHADEWGVRSLSPTGIYDDAGPWVLYKDHAAVITALRSQQPAPATQQAEVRPVTPYTCPKCHALWLHWPAEQTGFGRDTLNCRSADHCHYCEKAGVEQLQRLERIPAALHAPQPSPSAAVALSDDLRDRLVAISEAVADQDDRAAQAMLREILKAPQPSPSAAAAVVVYEQKENEMHVWFRPARMHGHPERTPIKATITKDRGNGIVDLTYDDGEFSGSARAVPNALRLPRNVREQVAVWWDVGFEMDFQTAVDNSLKKKKDDPPPQPSPTAQAADSEPAVDGSLEVADAMADSQYLAGVSAGWNAANADDPNAALQKLHESRAGYLKPLSAARAPADSVLDDAALSPTDADLLEKAISDFEEWGETDVPDAALRRFAAAGYLECVHYHVMPTAQDAIDAARKQGANHD